MEQIGFGVLFRPVTTVKCIQLIDNELFGPTISFDPNDLLLFIKKHSSNSDWGVFLGNEILVVCPISFLAKCPFD